MSLDASRQSSPRGRDLLSRGYARAAGALGLASVLWGSLPGCNFDQQGISPTPATLNFPNAVALSRPLTEDSPSRHLFVVNSNFDLRFNDGTLMALDLDQIAGRGEGDRGLLEREGCTEAAPCIFRDVASFLSSEVGIGSHADGLAVSTEGSRLYIPGRVDRDLTYVDWLPDQARFECEQEVLSGPVERCGSGYRMGAEGVITRERELALNGDPVAVSTGRLEDLGGAPGSGDFVLLALRDGRVALFIDRGGARATPTLTHVLGGLPPSAITMTLQPRAGVAWVTSSTSRSVARVGVFLDGDPTRSFLYDAGPLRLGGVDDAQDLRDIQFDPERPDERAFVLARRPESVITLDLTRTGVLAGDVGLGDLYRVGAGPSRLAVARLAGRTHVLASSFNARRLFVIDVEHGALVAVVGGFSGPFELAVDEARQLLYVADFSVSVVRVLDLAPLADSLPPYLIATLGDPTPVERFAD